MGELRRRGESGSKTDIEQGCSGRDGGGGRQEVVTICGSGHFWSVAHVGRQTGIKIATKHSACASQILDADGRHWARQP